MTNFLYLKGPRLQNELANATLLTGADPVGETDCLRQPASNWLRSSFNSDQLMIPKIHCSATVHLTRKKKWNRELHSSQVIDLKGHVLHIFLPTMCYLSPVKELFPHASFVLAWQEVNSILSPLLLMFTHNNYEKTYPINNHRTRSWQHIWFRLI